MDTTLDSNGGVGPRPLALIAEDASAQIRLIQICMERAGCRVAAVRDGCQAMSQIEIERPDIILLDVDLPGLNGFQVLDRVRKNPQTRTIPVIMLTAHAKDSVLFAEWADTADVFMTKPFSPEDLIATVRATLSSVA